MSARFLILLLLAFSCVDAQSPHDHNLVWASPSENSAGSMPLGGGDIGLNVWAEGGDLLFYMAQSGAFDENNTLLKLGRVRVHVEGVPFAGKGFQQELKLAEGSMVVEAQGVKVLLWVDVFHPLIHVALKTDKARKIQVGYESWRHQDRVLDAKELRQNSWKTPQPSAVVTKADQFEVAGDQLIFYHKNEGPTIMDATVTEQGLDSLRLDDPLHGRISGGYMRVKGFPFKGNTEGRYANSDYRSWLFENKKPGRSAVIEIGLNTGIHADDEVWRAELTRTVPSSQSATINWWKQFWQRSFIDVESSDSAIAAIDRNYKLFRYMLGCNSRGDWPTKFNGGLFTFDPVFINKDYPYTPDFRLWGGGTFTAQNQRLVYQPLLKTGDYDLLQTQLNFYLKLQYNAEQRTQAYWHHRGASFTEQLENFGLPNYFEYGKKRPANYDKGVEYNAWLNYEWETVLEFCQMMIDKQRYNGDALEQYLPFIESCLRFFDEHYRMLQSQRDTQPLDGNGHYVFYPSSAAESYKLAYNSTTLISGLTVVLQKLLRDSAQIDTTRLSFFKNMYKALPPVPVRYIDGKPVLAPAESWSRIRNSEAPQLYPVYPWGLYGVGRPGLDTARNTWFYDPQVVQYRSHVGWRQYNIFAARLGMTDTAARYAVLKFADGPYRFPAFWGPGFDWSPDHNWGGSAMIGLQEMLLQDVDQALYLFPAWPRDWDVHFKLHAPGNTLIEARLKNGRLQDLKIEPAERLKDIVLPDWLR